MDLTSEIVLPTSDNSEESAMDVCDTLPSPSDKINTGSNVSSLPPEVLFSIFLRAIPPFTLLDTSLSAGEHSTWSQALRLMHSIVIVCRGWYNVGIISLYENICIRRRHQLECFRHTITSLAANKHLDLLVKSLTIGCYIPKDDFDFGKNLEIVLGRCTSMSTFSYDAPFVPPTQAITILFPAYITHLRLDGHFHFDNVLPMLGQLEKTLLSLHFMIWDDSKKPLDYQTLQSESLSLPSLHSLSVTVLFRFEVLDILRRQWHMPSLRRLTVSRYDYSGANGEEHDYPMLQTSIISFLALFGCQIRQLHIGVAGFRFKPERFKELLKFCPRLERIIMNPATFLRKSWSNSNYFVHPRLRCIDLTHSFYHKRLYRSSKLCLSKENLPSLGCVRRFCNLPGDLRKWLDECSPSPDAEADQFSIDVFHQQLDFQDGLFIWRFERDVLKDVAKQGGTFSGSFTVWDSDSESDSSCHSASDDESSSSQGLDCEWTSADEDMSDY